MHNQDVLAGTDNLDIEMAFFSTNCDPHLQIIADEYPVDRVGTCVFMIFRRSNRKNVEAICKSVFRVRLQ